MNGDTYILSIILIITAVTVLLRFLPFLIFQKKTPKAIIYLGNVLPYAIMGMLIVYCLRNISFISGSYGIPEIISVVAVILLHKWKHNTLISILGGTALYMIFVQLIF